MKSKRFSKILYLVLIGLFTAIIGLMSFTPLGYIKNGGLSITLLVIPVSAGAVTLSSLSAKMWEGKKGVLFGALGGAWLGLVFGVTSLIQCFTGDSFGAALVSLNFFGTAVTCLIPRMLTGLLTSLVFSLLTKINVKYYTELYNADGSVFFQGDAKRKIARTTSITVASLLCPLFNTLLFMSSLVLFFYNTEYIQEYVTNLGAANPFNFVLLFVGVNGVIEVLVCFVVGVAVTKALDVAMKRML